MCPVCWVNGFLALLFGASAVSFGTEWYILAPSIALTIWGIYKIWDGIKRGRKFTDEQLSLIHISEPTRQAEMS